MEAPPELTISFDAMGSRCEIRLAGVDEPIARAWADFAIADVRRIEAKYSRYRAESVTSLINQAAGVAPIDVDDETAALIDFGAALHAESERRFDLTSGVLRQAWDFNAGRVPADAKLAEVLQRVGWHQVHWDRPRLFLPLPGMELDFGGIGKEYAADRAAALLTAAGARHGFVNLGGDIRGVGPQSDGSPWRIGIQHPRDARKMLGGIELAAAGLATSGDYERFFERDGRRYCHVLDPRTGWPAQHWQSVSVVAPTCVAAGACATIAMLKPETDAIAFLERQGVRYLAVSQRGELLSG